MSEEFVILIKDLFADNHPVIVKSKGGSMVPAIPRDSVVRIEAVKPELVKLGDVVVYEQDKFYTIIHRVVRKTKKKGKYFVQTWGDNVDSPDALVALEAVHGKVTAYKTRDGQWRSLKFPQLMFLKLFVMRYIWYWSGAFIKKCTL